jgi:hypothetical protein
VVRVGIVEEQRELSFVKLSLQRLLLRLELLGQFGVFLSQLRELDQVSCPPLQLVPYRRLAAVFGSLSSDLAGLRGVVPGVRGG